MAAEGEQYLGTLSVRMGSVGSFYIPKHRIGRPDSKGEDAHFTCLRKQTIGVADGVGSWDAMGIDAGQYARQLMKNCVDQINRKPDSEPIIPKHVLRKAYDNTNYVGSSTACIVTLRDNFLHAVNVGDSGFLVIREGVGVLYQSPVQQRGFNCPYQLGKCAKEDKPESGLDIKVAVQQGDVVVAGTDGLFDNVYATEIGNLVAKAKRSSETAGDLARMIAKFALGKSRDKAVLTPFSEAARQAGFRHVGGKPDDITVVIAYITRDRQQPRAGYWIGCIPFL